MELTKKSHAYFNRNSKFNFYFITITKHIFKSSLHFLIENDLKIVILYRLIREMCQNLALIFSVLALKKFSKIYFFVIFVFYMLQTLILYSFL